MNGRTNSPDESIIRTTPCFFWSKISQTSCAHSAVFLWIFCNLVVSVERKILLSQSLCRRRCRALKRAHVWQRCSLSGEWHTAQTTRCAPMEEHRSTCTIKLCECIHWEAESSPSLANSIDSTDELLGKTDQTCESCESMDCLETWGAMKLNSNEMQLEWMTSQWVCFSQWNHTFWMGQGTFGFLGLRITQSLCPSSFG